MRYVFFWQYNFSPQFIENIINWLERCNKWIIWQCSFQRESLVKFEDKLVIFHVLAQALVSFKKCMPPPLPYFKVNIYPFPLPHFASIFFAYLWSFRWPSYIVTLPRYFSFRLPHLNIPTEPSSDELDKNIQRTWLSENLLIETDTATSGPV